MDDSTVGTASCWTGERSLLFFYSRKEMKPFQVATNYKYNCRGITSIVADSSTKIVRVVVGNIFLLSELIILGDE